MTSEIEQLQSRNLNMSSNMEDGSEKIRSLESTLDSAYKEITELQKQIIEKDSNKETRQKLEEQKSQLEKEFEDSQRLWNQERDQLHSRIQDLQDAQGRLETQFVRKEENLKEKFYLFFFFKKCVFFTKSSQVLSVRSNRMKVDGPKMWK